MLGRFATVLEHGAHGGIAIDIRIFALKVGFLRRTESDVAERVHEARIDFADAGTLGTVQDVALGGIGIAALGESLFNGILNFFDVRLRLVGGLEMPHGVGSDLESSTAQNVVTAQKIQLILGSLNLFVQFAGSSESLDDSVGNLLDVERHFAAVALLHS